MILNVLNHSQKSDSLSLYSHAYFSLGKYQEAVEAYEKGIALDPNSELMKQSLATAKSKLASGGSATVNDSNDSLTEAAPRETGAGGFPGFPGAGGPGGMDIGSMLNNPNFMNMGNLTFLYI